MPFYLELADLLVEPGDEGFIGFLAFLVVPAENAGRRACGTKRPPILMSLI